MTRTCSTATSAGSNALDTESGEVLVARSTTGRCNTTATSWTSWPWPTRRPCTRSQGSEYPAVVIPVHTQHYVMLQRNLLYTAVTRGKRLVVLVGTRKALGIAVRNGDVARRATRLAARLRSKGRSGGQLTAERSGFTTSARRPAVRRLRCGCAATSWPRGRRRAGTGRGPGRRRWRWPGRSRCPADPCRRCGGRGTGRRPSSWTSRSTGSPGKCPPLTSTAPAPSERSRPRRHPGGRNRHRHAGQRRGLAHVRGDQRRLANQRLQRRPLALVQQRRRRMPPGTGSYTTGPANRGQHLHNRGQIRLSGGDHPDLHHRPASALPVPPKAASRSCRSRSAGRGSTSWAPPCRVNAVGIRTVRAPSARAVTKSLTRPAPPVRVQAPDARPPVDLMRQVSKDM